MHGIVTGPRDLGTAVRAVRIAAGMTQRELSQALGVHQRWLSELESGHPKVANSKLFDVLSSLGINLTWHGPDLSATDPPSQAPAQEVGTRR